MLRRLENDAASACAPADFDALRPRGLCGYADLLLVGAVGGDAARAALADLLGYQRARRQPDSDGKPREVAPEEATDPVTFTPAVAMSAAFWRLEQRIFLTAGPPPERVAPPPLAIEMPARRVRVTPLAAWSALVPALRAGGAERAEGHAPDIGEVLRLLEVGRLPGRLPRLRLRRWGRRAQIIVDRSDRLTPFFDDQDADRDSLEAHLQRLFPRGGVERARYLGGAEVLVAMNRLGDTVEYRPPELGSLVIVLGDLGCLARDPTRIVRFWADLGARLARAGCRAVAITPCSRGYWRPELLKSWTLIEGDPAGPSRRITQDGRKTRADALLRLASIVGWLEPGLLRDIRLLLGDAADAATEVDALQSDAIGRRSPQGAVFDGRWARAIHDELLRSVINAADDAEREQLLQPLRRVVDLVMRWHGAGMNQLVWFTALLALDPAIRAFLPEQIRVDHVAAAEQALKDLAPRLASLPSGRRWYRGVYERAPDHFHRSRDPSLKAAKQLLYTTAYQGFENRPAAPADFEPGLTSDPFDGQERVVEVRQVGGNVLTRETTAHASAGSLLATLATVNGDIAVLTGNAFWAADKPPPWADDWGRDSYGAWVTFSVVGADGQRVTQRMRWCPPGRFVMGSPETEEGRYDYEGPVHEVRLADGFWVFDTACTEELWTAVMNRPIGSRKSGKFPITGISWPDAQEFIATLNGRLPGLGLSLPSEARWEYACRSGTTTSYSFGATIDKTRVNFDSKGTVLAGSLPPNSWGLYEMHGNVYEWCEDTWHNSYESAPNDGSAWMDGDTGAALRVIRGGSWIDDARYVRSASRFVLAPTDRFGYLGFRCARVQATGGGEQVAAPAWRPGAERGRPRGSTGDAALLRAGEAAPCPAPRAGALIIRSDREELGFSRFEKPDWASALGRDRFGLFTEFTVPDTDVTQRLRWIPPGRFQMGSPNDEPGRFNDEGPQHLITISEGYWLFDTPCTQALWQAVMQDNPSRFKSPTRPVEQVDFADVGQFLAVLNARFRDKGLDLALSLPSEAQWEYAARAGTDTATYAGPMVILGEHNAPVLDAIAWYGGNSGEDFDLENGLDASDWKDKQYEFSRAGTRPVGLKQANPWGLYDMLGNVWEWCADTWHRSYDGAPTDGLAWIDTADGAAYRVTRGGSWFDVARLVRSAFRIDVVPSHRNDGLGFRCARVQVESGAVAEDGAEQAQRAERGAAPSRPPRTRGATKAKRKRPQGGG